jgi:pimeloyl-ACP methyl ester carboxylesterase
MIYTAMIGLLASAATALPTSEIPSHLRQRQYGANETVSNFMDIPSSAKLEWTPCYERFQCANLEVPLDYEDPSVGTTVVAWIRQEAANTTEQDLLYNPGGPGGSGIQSILRGRGDSIMEVTGGKYNVVSFDPRGVNASGIDLTCFPDEEAREDYAPAKYSTDADVFASAVVQNKFCVAFNANTTARYASTMAVVQDMMHFTDLQAELNGLDTEEALIYYYGVSYGTVIGHTLASTYPDRIGRVIVDSNVNSEEYYNGIDEQAISDTDDGLRYFFSLCAEAGEEKCAFAGNSSSGQDVEDRFNTMLERIDKDPIQYMDLESGLAGIITSTDVLSQIFTWLYSPTGYFDLMARALAAAENRNVAALFAAINTPSSDDSGPFNYTSMAEGLAQQFVTALDAAGRSPMKTLDDYLKTVATLEKASPWFGKGYAALNPLMIPGFDLIPPQSQIFPGKSPNTQHQRTLYLANNTRLQPNQDQEPNSLCQHKCRSHHSAR